ncbi:peptidoglycan deacetylase (plasmid) [Antarctobacter heliothermus]|uniref:Chitooligosaccharide deacetylase n=1 Tax=Antarctobacter heliothermus TaxID=74033 RepID=A0A222EBT8_9RHOB|nr:polysaccharide deacetylase [Antarctobacter heliothermus]ASP23666.1 peptidoglycan deacetylase [Antarctobacter heliothermus]
MPRHLVCLTFDFDAMSGLVARGMKSPTPVSRGEFGAMTVVERLLPLLERYRLPASFFVPGTVIETYRDHCARIHAAGHEIGNHGYTHVPPANLTPQEEEDGLVRASDLIEEVTGSRPRGYRSPSWDLSDVTVDLLLKHGFDYESSLMGHDHMPYFARRGDVVPDDGPVTFGETTSLVEMPISWSLDDFPHFEFMRTATSLMPGLSNARLVLENFVADFEFMTRNTDWGVLTYTFHPYVVGRGHRMLMLEKLIHALQERGAVFSTMRDVAVEFRGRT